MQLHLSLPRCLIYTILLLLYLASSISLIISRTTWHFFFFLNDRAPPEISTLPLHAALPILLAVVLAGKGVAGLQEAGRLSASPIHWPRIEVLGIYPSAETAIAQAVVLAVALAGFAMNAVKARNPRPA